jgi:hypothetical protein
LPVIHEEGVRFWFTPMASGFVVLGMRSCGRIQIFGT